MLGGFERYLIQKALVGSKYIPYYVKWVSYCYSFLKQPDSCLLGPEQLQSYLKSISKTREDWQVKRAEHALRLYGYYLLSVLEEPKHVVSKGPPSPEGNPWPALEKKMHDALRLRHRSYSTEKTYLKKGQATAIMERRRGPSE